MKKGYKLSDLIEALQILASYEDPDFPTNCSHNLFAVCWREKHNVSEEDKKRLDELGFLDSDTEDIGPGWYSNRFGSC